MAALGDSITRAAALSTTSLGDRPERSWATGEDASSHRSRLVDGGAQLATADVHNLAVSGATSTGLPDQARSAVDVGAEYVTILMGANDACASGVERMTPVADFRGHVREALDILHEGLPEARIFVASIPDVGHLWELFKDDPGVVETWDSFGVCSTFLSTQTSDEDRHEARVRLIAYNDVLERGCSALERCLYDGGAVFDHGFETEDVSPLDHFHPSERGQQKLAEITWEESFWSNP